MDVSSASPTTPAAAAAAAVPALRLPSAATFENAAKIAMKDDQPIMMDYWKDSLEKKVLIGQRESTKERMLVRNSEEYTSVIQQIFKVGTDYIIQTENSIYLVDTGIPLRKIS